MNGIWRRVIFASEAKSSPRRWLMPMAPDVPYAMASGRALASATTSARVLYLDLDGATIIMPPSEIPATGANESVV
ncbi:hypothetical protein D3C72_2215090 [compost metagenome]